MADSGVNWENINTLSDAGINWSDIDVLSDAGVNWMDIDVMSDAGVNWADVDVLSDSGVNWVDIGTMTTATVNWDDIAYMSGTGVNWLDVGISSGSGINWIDLATMTASNINWSDIAYLADNAQALVTNVSDILTVVEGLDTKIGDSDDTGADETLFGLINNIDIPEGFSDDVQTLVTAIEDLSELDVTDLNNNITTIVDALGTIDDTSTEETVFGTLQLIEEYVDTLETLLGVSTDTELSSTIFGDLTKLKSDLTVAKGSAASAYSEVQAVRTDLGAQGMSPSTYGKIQTYFQMQE